MKDYPVRKWVDQAAERINSHIRRTPLEYSAYLSQLTGARVYLKLENYQVTGSFKARGGLNKVLALTEEEKARGVVTASTGNHAAAVAHALSIAGTKGVIYMPETVSQAKVENLKQFPNVELKFVGDDSVVSELTALEHSRSTNTIFISPYNDPEVIGGQGTIAKEVLEQLGTTDAILVPVGGGGMIAGIAGYAKNIDSDISVIGCQPENSAVMYHSVKAGEILEMESLPTVSDGTAGGIEQGSITFDIVTQHVDGFHLLEEDEIKYALSILLKKHYMLAEGSAGLSVAGLIRNKEQYVDKNVVLIICGNKMKPELIKEVLDIPLS